MISIKFLRTTEEHVEVIKKVTPKINCLQSWPVTPLVPLGWENLHVENGV